MQYSILLNQTQAIEWGLNPTQAIVFSFLVNVPAWARGKTFPVFENGDEVNGRVIDQRVFFWIDKTKMRDELPIVSTKPDTLYRVARQLEAKGLIEKKSVVGKGVWIRITDEGARWIRSGKSGTGPHGQDPQPRKQNQGTLETGPSKLGNASDNHYTSNHITKDHKSESAQQQKSKTRLNKNDLIQKYDVDPEAAAAFLEKRRAVRAPLTPLSMTALINQFSKAGITPAQGIAICAANDWRGFRADWNWRETSGAEMALGAPQSASTAWNDFPEG